MQTAIIALASIVLSSPIFLIQYLAVTAPIRRVLAIHESGVAELDAIQSRARRA